MPGIFPLILFALLLGGCAGLSPSPQPELPRSGILAGRVVRVVDGDTVIIEISVVLRAIDTPEKYHRCGDPQEQAVMRRKAAAATDYLAGELPAGSKVLLHDLKIGGYRRLIARVLRRSDGYDMASALLRAGHAKQTTGRRAVWCRPPPVTAKRN